MNPHNKGGRPPWATKKLKNPNIEIKAYKLRRVGSSKQKHTLWEDSIIESTKFSTKLDHYHSTPTPTPAYSIPPQTTPSSTPPPTTHNRYTRKILRYKSHQKTKQLLTEIENTQIRAFLSHNQITYRISTAIHANHRMRAAPPTGHTIPILHLFDRSIELFIYPEDYLGKPLCRNALFNLPHYFKNQDQ